jgi:C-terminal processing protease CtpA/Prc
LKFTVAKWFTGKTQIGIDGIGIKPDIEVKLDEEQYKKGIDNQLEKALEIK